MSYSTTVPVDSTSSISRLPTLKYWLRMERAAGAADGPLPCCPNAATAASEDMRRITSYLGQRHGGKHARGLS